MSLPQKWQDPEVPPEETPTTLDPNMSLAHVTYNTSMILLHQRIGYPASELKGLKLPNLYSAETCQSAAIEVGNITKKYLALAPQHMPISPHFSFCIFIGAKVLLGELSVSWPHYSILRHSFTVHSRYYRVDLASQFTVLAECLEEISRRWGFDEKEIDGPTTSPLSQQFAVHLRELYDRSQNNPDFHISVLDSLDDDSSNESRCSGQEGHQDYPHAHQFAPNPFTPPSQPQPVNSVTFGVVPPENGWSSIPGSDKGLIASSDSATNNRQPSQTDETGSKGRVSPLNGYEVLMPRSDITEMPDELSDILQTLTNQQYMEMDRVMSFDEFQFAPFLS